MEVYLVDFENVRSEGLKNIQRLKEEDEVYIFHSSNSDTITIQAHKNISKSLAKVKFFNITAGGKNALDFQLSSFLGYTLAIKKDCNKIYIVTNDNGFLLVIKFWQSNFKNLTTDIFKISSISGIDNISKDNIDNIPKNNISNVPKNNAVTVIDTQPERNRLVNEINHLLGGGYSKDKLINIINLFKKDMAKNVFHNELIALFGQEKGIEIYHLLRPKYDEIKNTIDKMSLTKN